MTDFRQLETFCCAYPDDAPWVNVVQQRIREDLYKEWNRRGSENPSFGVLVVPSESGDCFLGVVVYEVALDGYGVIPLLGVDPLWRRQRVATELKQAAMDMLAARGCVAVRSDVHEDNEPMHAVNRQFSPQTDISSDDPEFILTAIAFDE